MLTFYNTLTKKKELFQSLVPNQVTLYTCGPTVYDYAHIGNLRTYIFEDVLKRTLVAHGYTVNHVMNITDVGHLTDDADSGDDKIEKGAAREGKSAWDIAAFYTDAFTKDCGALNITLPDDTQMPRATAYIQEQIAMIEVLEKKGHTYTTSDGVYFDTATLDDYGKLAALDIAGLEEGARVKKNSEKRNATDFALWKFSPQGKKRAMEWSSPWGTGFPGWHIECSAMIQALLGTTIDIHCGGIDHVPVHHTNEIAQSESAHDAPLAHFWMHGEFLLINEGRMGKSEGNFITLDTLRKKGISPMAYRLFVLGAHYRSKLNFTWDELIGQQQRYAKIVRTAFAWGKPSEKNDAFYAKFLDALSNDLGTPSALAIIQQLIDSDLQNAVKAATLFAMDEMLGLGISERVHILQQQVNDIPVALQSLLDAREEAKAQKNYALADELREKIHAHGFEIEDRKNARPLIIPIEFV